MKKILFCLAIPLIASAQSIEISCDRQDAVYSCGDKTVFTVKVLGADKKPVKQGNASVKLTNFGSKVLREDSVDLSKGNPFTVEGSLDKPSFLKCEVAAKIAGKNLRKVYGAAFDPLKIKNPVACPADFDDFWRKAVAKLAKEVPLDAKVEPLPKYTNDKHESFLVSFATCNDRRIYGFLSIPKGKSGPFPAVVNVPGAGLGSFTPATWHADQGRISLILTVHAFPPAIGDKTEQGVRYSAANKSLRDKWHVSNYYHSGATSRETFFYYSVILGINRAVDWLAARDDVDKARFWYEGTSQGGGFGFYLVGLNKHFTKGVSFVPALTGLLDFKADRQSGWPRLVENQPQESKAAAEKIAPYFDAANFAARITCPYRVAVGFSDETCAPAAVYSGYNLLRVKDKQIVHGLGMPHAVYGHIYKQLRDYWLFK